MRGWGLTPLISDFGLSIEGTSERYSGQEPSHGAGTSGFKAPEQDRIRAYFGPSDDMDIPCVLTSASNVWGIGAIMWELIELEFKNGPRYGGGYTVHDINRNKKQTIHPIQDLKDHHGVVYGFNYNYLWCNHRVKKYYPHRLLQLVQHCLQFHPMDRPSLSFLREAIERELENYDFAQIGALYTEGSYNGPEEYRGLVDYTEAPEHAEYSAWHGPNTNWYFFDGFVNEKANYLKEGDQYYTANEPKQPNASSAAYSHDTHTSAFGYNGEVPYAHEIHDAIPILGIYRKDLIDVFRQLGMPDDHVAKLTFLRRLRRVAQIDSLTDTIRPLPNSAANFATSPWADSYHDDHEDLKGGAIGKRPARASRGKGLRSPGTSRTESATYNTAPESQISAGFPDLNEIIRAIPPDGTTISALAKKFDSSRLSGYAGKIVQRFRDILQSNPPVVEFTGRGGGFVKIKIPSVEEVIAAIKSRPMTYPELCAHFSPRIPDNARNDEEISWEFARLVEDIADVDDGTGVLRLRRLDHKPAKRRRDS
jgi:hypothetical protein